MGDLLFKCSVCRKGLAVDVVMLGRRFVCPACGNTIHAPDPQIVFACPVCKAKLFAPDRAAMQTFACPNCDQELSVPDLSTVPCPACGVGVELDSDLYASYAGRSFDCPQCGAPVDVPPLPSPPREAPATHAPPPPGSLPRGFGFKTMKLDELADQATAQNVFDMAKCPYCHSKVHLLGDRSCVCKSCGRIIRLVKSGA